MLFRSQANSSGFKVVLSGTMPPHVILNSLDATQGSPFLGTNQAVENNEYEVKSYSLTSLVVRGVLSNSGGKIVEVKLKKKTPLTISDVKDLLTGGSSRSWKLDPASGANSIIVGTEGNPGEYYGGGPLEPNCQTDDVYTFTSADALSYNANGSTFNGGNISPNYN